MGTNTLNPPAALSAEMIHALSPIEEALADLSGVIKTLIVFAGSPNDLEPQTMLPLLHELENISETTQAAFWTAWSLAGGVTPQAAGQ